VPRTPASRRILPLVVLVGAGLLVAGCTAAPQPAPESTAPTPVVSEPAPTPTPTGPQLIADATAQENLPYFTQIVQAVWNTPDQFHGRAYIDALTAGGFDKSAMQVTEDESTVGNPAESIQFSVRWGADCLVGQVGPATGAPVATVLPGLSDGGCLVGTTRAIDW
jgi:hypothetical protein